MNRKLLKLKPTHFLCPYCGEWHKWTEGDYLAYFSSSGYTANLKCPIDNDCYTIYFDFSSNELKFNVEKLCGRCRQDYIGGSISIDEIIENYDESSVTFKESFTSHSPVNEEICYSCSFVNKCLYAELGEAGDGIHMNIPFGFKFKKEEFDEIVKEERLLQEQKEAAERKAKQEEEENMAAAVETSKKTTILERVLDHSPKENVELVKSWVEKHNSTLKWSVPVLLVYAAYRILKSNNLAFNAENIGSFCDNEAGIELEELKDKTKLEELLKVGAMAVGAYSAVKGTSWIFTDKKLHEVCVEDVEEGLGELENLKNDDSEKSFFKKAENLLPVAIAVVTVYLLTEKELPLGDTVNEKINMISTKLKNTLVKYAGKAKDVVENKLDIDLSSEEGKHKARNFTLLAMIVAGVAFVYGKKMLGNKYVEGSVSEEEKPIQKVIDALLKIMSKLAPALFGATVSMLVARNVLNGDVAEEIYEEEEDDELDEEIEFFEEGSGEETE